MDRSDRIKDLEELQTYVITYILFTGGITYNTCKSRHSLCALNEPVRTLYRQFCSQTIQEQLCALVPGWVTASESYASCTYVEDVKQ